MSLLPRVLRHVPCQARRLTKIVSSPMRGRWRSLQHRKDSASLAPVSLVWKWAVSGADWGRRLPCWRLCRRFLARSMSKLPKKRPGYLPKQGLAIHTGVKIGKVVSGKQVTVEYTDANGTAQSADFDQLIVSIGRLPNTEGLNAAGAGLALDERGFVQVDADCRTNLPNVWAVGDVVRGPMLAHKAEEEGVAVAERIAGRHGHVDFNTVPWVIYTSPEIAWVGKNEQQLKAEGVEYRVGTFPFMANGRARALGDTTGMVKMLADARTDRILGVHIIGPMASELIAEAVVAMEFGASSEDIALICHAHPSLSEAMKEAALAVDKRTLNL